MSLRVDLLKLSRNIEHTQREVRAIKLATNETAADERPVIWNRSISRLRDVLLQLLTNHAVLIHSLQESMDCAAIQGEGVKPAVSSGVNGGDTTKE